MKKYFIGWTNIKWGIKEIIKMYSDQPSFFSKKRFHEGVSFFIFVQGAVYTLKNYVKTVNDFTIWCIPVLLVCGYVLKEIQKEKLLDVNESK